MRGCSFYVLKNTVYSVIYSNNIVSNSVRTLNESAYRTIRKMWWQLGVVARAFMDEERTQKNEIRSLVVGSHTCAKSDVLSWTGSNFFPPNRAPWSSCHCSRPECIAHDQHSPFDFSKRRVLRPGVIFPKFKYIVRTTGDSPPSG